MCPKAGPPRFLLACLLMACLGFMASPAWSSGLAKLAKNYTHASQGEPLPSLLSDFATAQGYSAAFTPGVQGLVSGEFIDMPPSQFLAGIRAGFGVEAYTLGSSLHFFHQSERQRHVLRINSMAPSRIRSSLLRMGALSVDLPSSASDSDRLFFFEGPQDYAAGLVASIQALEESQLGEQVIKVFPLKHAWADDTTVESANNVTTIPGVASVLRAIVTGQGQPTVRTIHRSDNSGKLMGTGLAANPQGQINAAASLPQASAAAGSPNIIAEPRMNAVIVTDQKHRIPYYEAVVAELDRPVDLVEIHAAIVDINANYARDLGINWGGSASGGSWAGTAGTMGSPTSALGTMADSGFNMTTIYTAGVNTFFSNIRALEEQGEAATLAKPSVLTMDNVQASIEYTTTFYVKLEGNESVDLVDVTSGTTLKVTPRIIRMDDGTPSRLTMYITIMDGQDPLSTDKNSWVSEIPPVKKVTINTQAVVGEEQSLLIGGFYYETLGDSKAGVPGLMNIPVAGALFRKRGETLRRMERLILITPRIIRYDLLSNPPPIPERVQDRGFAISPTDSQHKMDRDPYEVKPRSGCASPTRQGTLNRQPDVTAASRPQQTGATQPAGAYSQAPSLTPADRTPAPEFPVRARNDSRKGKAGGSPKQ